ncbi:hypothetical protein B0I37DRAFT_309397 [Chaetomium sp. MPI-CAGE-AT-0009]|nr:hypothetical protein B0I37DRAFT_309397 [Chaetomium sp. MPI-CAGE-AT-0009]
MTVYSYTVSSKTLKWYDDGIRAIAFSPDGKTLTSALYDKTIGLWDITTGIY